MNRTLIILNPHAGSGRAGRLWSEIEPLLWQELGELVVAITQYSGDVAEHLDKARDAGLTRVVAIGGDGTNHAIINAIQAMAEADPTAPKMTFAQLPMGTGQDFARTLGIPQTPREAVHWIVNATSKPIDLGYLQYDKQGTHFLNIGSVGISGNVSERVNQIRKRRPWTFKLATIKSLLAYHPAYMKVYLDDEVWYEDKSWAVIVANGRIFGHGMAIAPTAEIDDGLFDVVLIEDVPRLQAVMALNTVYTGKHLLRRDVHHKQAKVVTIESRDGKIAIDLDGEHAHGEQMCFAIKPGALNMLVGSQ